MEFDKEFLGKLLEQAMENPRLRQNFDLRTSSADTSQRMLNALQPQTEVSIHRHEKTAETVICLVGKLEEIIYEEVNQCIGFEAHARYLYGYFCRAGAPSFQKGKTNILDFN